MASTTTAAPGEEPDKDKALEGELVEEKKDGDLVVVPPSDVLALRDPNDVIAEAQDRARAVDKVLKAKPKPVIIRGEHYLEISDWGLVAQMYGAAAYTDWTRPIDRTSEGLGRGWEARALVIDLRSGNTVGAAEAECLDSEEEWGQRPEYKWFDDGKVPPELVPMIKEKMPSKYNKGMRCKVQVGVELVPDAARRSMAQTRAGSRALAQRFRWVVALAGYKGTPAEEMPRSAMASGGDYDEGNGAGAQRAADQRRVTPMDPADVTLIKQTVKVMVEQAKANDPVATAVQIAWKAWFEGPQGPKGWDALFGDDAYTYAAKRLLGLSVEAPKAQPTTTAETHERFDPDKVPTGATPASPVPAPPASPRGANEWPADEQKFIRDTYNGIVAVKKNTSKRETPGAISEALKVFNAFATWMNSNKFNWSGEQGYTSIWKRYDMRDDVFKLLGLEPPAPAPAPGFDPDEEAK